MRSAMPSADRCKACVDGAKRKCTCGGKVPRKRLRHDEVVNARGDPLGFAAAAVTPACVNVLRYPRYICMWWLNSLR